MRSVHLTELQAVIRIDCRGVFLKDTERLRSEVVDVYGGSVRPAEG